MSQTVEKVGLRKRIYVIMDTEQENPDWVAALFETFITSLIILSVIAIVAESFIDNRYTGSLAEWTERLARNKEYEYYYQVFENFTVIVFTVEYFLRILTADYRYPNEKTYFHAAFRFMKSGSGLIDFIAISPFVFNLVNLDFRFLRALKISRLLRAFKLSSLTRSVSIVGDVFVEKRAELGITLFVTFVMLLISSTLMWYVEGSVQPKSFPNIIASFWWAIATLTTVGYGDVFPITPWGKLLSGIIAVLGIGIVALPAGILSSAFIEKLDRERERREAEALEKMGAETKANIREDLHVVATSAGLTGANSKSPCQSRFGEKFAYCPYCGEQLDEQGHHALK